MTVEEAMREAIRNYLDPEVDTTLSPELGNSKYTLEYFDNLEAELLTKKPKTSKSGGKV